MTLPMKKENTAMTVSDSQAMSEFGLSMDDIQVPRLLLQQKMSNSGLKVGDLMNSLSSAVVCGYDKPMEVIPLKLKDREWVTYDKSQNPPKFVRSELYTKANANMDWEFKEKDPKTGNLLDLSRRPCANFLVLIRDNLGGARRGFPVCLTYKSTYFKTGQAIASNLSTMLIDGVKPYTQSFTVVSKNQPKGTPAYAILECHPGSETTAEEQAKAQFWIDQMRAPGVTVTVDNTEEAFAEPATTPQSKFKPETIRSEDVVEGF